MARLRPQRDMSAEDILSCSYAAMAIVALCGHVTQHMPETGPQRLAGEIGLALEMAEEVMAAVHDAVEAHEGLAR